MQKQAPSLGRILAMVIFAMSCFGLLLYLWLAFGGPVPLKAQSYRVTAAFPEAATLAQEADVRIAGVSVGKVKTKELNDEDGTIKPNTLVEIEIEDEYAPVPANTKATLRQKTLLGETYVELTPGTSGEKLDDGGRLPDAQVEPTVELDEIYQAFDKPTRAAFRAWIKNSAGAIKGGTGQHLNDAIGNLEGFAVGRRRHPRGARPAGQGTASADQEHGRDLQGAERAHERPPRPDRQLEQRLRGDGIARRGARRDVQHLPDLPRRVEGHSRPAPGLRQRHAPARPGPAAGGATTSARRCATSATWPPI